MIKLNQKTSFIKLGIHLRTKMGIENIGCGLLVAKTRDGEIKCGEKIFGKNIYCSYCQNLIAAHKETESN